MRDQAAVLEDGKYFRGEGGKGEQFGGWSCIPTFTPFLIARDFIILPITQEIVDAILAMEKLLSYLINETRKKSFSTTQFFSLVEELDLVKILRSHPERAKERISKFLVADSL